MVYLFLVKLSLPTASSPVTSVHGARPLVDGFLEATDAPYIPIWFPIRVLRLYRKDFNCFDLHFDNQSVSDHSRHPRQDFTIVSRVSLLY